MTHRAIDAAQPRARIHEKGLEALAVILDPFCRGANLVRGSGSGGLGGSVDYDCRIHALIGRFRRRRGRTGHRIPLRSRGRGYVTLGIQIACQPYPPQSVGSFRPEAREGLFHAGWWVLTRLSRKALRWWGIGEGLARSTPQPEPPSTIHGGPLLASSTVIEPRGPAGASPCRRGGRGPTGLPHDVVLPSGQHGG